MRPIAYTYKADHHCPSCAFARFGKDDHGFVPEDAEDSEGNPIGVICPWDCWWNEQYEAETLVCGDCQREIDRTEATVPPNYVEDALTAYVDCAIWSSTWSESEHDEPRPMDDNYGPDDVADEALDDMRSDVESFVDSEKDDLMGYVEASQCGHDLWLTRNHHGAGFWDRGLGERGDRLTKAAHVYGSSDLTVGDDGKLYL